MGMDSISGQTSIFELDPELAHLELTWVAADESGPVVCQVCKHPVRKQESADAEIGECCAARIGRAVMAARKLQRQRRQALAGATPQARRTRRKQRRARAA